MHQNDLETVFDVSLEKDHQYSIDIELQPYIVFKILKEKLRVKPYPYRVDDKVQWQFHIKYKDYCIEVYDWKYYKCTAVVYGDTSKDDCEAVMTKFIKLLVGFVDNYTSRLKKTIRKATVRYIENPFALNIESASILHHQLEDNLKDKSSSSHSSDLGEIINDFYVQDRLKQATVQGSYILYLSAFEGFLNLIYHLFLKNEIRKDPKKVSDLSRANLNTKIPDMSKYCICFDEGVEFKGETFDKYFSIINLRNDFIHANLTDSMENAILPDSDFRFYVLSNKYEKNYGLPYVFSALTKDHINFVADTIRAVVEEIIDRMELSYRDEFRKVIYLPEIVLEVNKIDEKTEFYKIVVPPEDW
jgi:hypothetical protein